MARIVQKFGGTSVADVERIKAVARRVKREADAGHEVAVVVSAMAGVTNQLVAWTNGFGGLPDQQEYDTVVASGEQITAGLTALALRELGLKARSFLGWQVPIETDEAHGKARIAAIPTAALDAALAAGEIPVIAGFKGVAPGSRVATLGRGGSDTSAVAVAAALGAERCDIFTDVDGVYTTDPRIVAKAKKLDMAYPCRRSTDGTNVEIGGGSRGGGNARRAATGYRRVPKPETNTFRNNGVTGHYHDERFGKLPLGMPSGRAFARRLRETGRINGEMVGGEWHFWAKP